MRFLLLAFLSVLVSCGQKNSSSSHSDRPVKEDYLTEVRQVDLLDVAMDVPFEVSGHKIIFKQSFSDSANGVTSTCSLGVANGEAYDFVVNGDSLMIKTSKGHKMSFKRISGDGEGLVGSWSGKFYEGRQLVLRRMTFVTQNRLIMRTHCES